MKKIIFSIGICIIFFVLVDLGLRIYLNARYAKWHNKQVVFPLRKVSGRACAGYYKLAPGKAWYNDGKLGIYSINSFGFRGPEFSQKKPEGVTRICALGGSTTFGYKAEDTDTYPYNLEKLLNANSAGKKFEVINCGFCGYRMSHIYNLFSKELIRYEPDIIIVFEAWNDASFAEAVFKKDFRLWLHQHLYYKWMLYTVLLEKYSSLRRGSPVPFFRPKTYSVLPDYANYLNKLAGLAKKQGIEVVFVKQPVCLIKASLLPDAAFLQVQRYYVSQLEKIGAKNSFLVVDPIEAMEKDPELFTEEIHLSPAGNIFLAKFIAEAILKDL